MRQGRPLKSLSEPPSLLIELHSVGRCLMVLVPLLPILGKQQTPKMDSTEIKKQLISLVLSILIITHLPVLHQIQEMKSDFNIVTKRQ